MVDDPSGQEDEEQQPQPVHYGHNIQTHADVHHCDQEAHLQLAK